MSDCCGTGGASVTERSLTVIVPVFNEESLVEASLKRLRVLDQSPELDRVQVIVVDDCSQDQTPLVLVRLARELPAMTSKTQWEFLRHARNQGKGAAVISGIRHANGAITVVHDADLEYDPRDILRMIPLFFTESADAVFGSRFMTHEYRRVLFFRHQLGNQLLTFLCNLVSDLNLTDMETCYKAIRTELLKSIPLKSHDFCIEPELSIKLARRNARVFEVAINYSGRTYREGKKIRWPDALRALWAIARFGICD